MASMPLVKANSPVRVTAFKVTFMVVSTLMSIFMQDQLAAISALTGASLTMFTCVLLPCAIYWKLCPISKVENIFLYTLFIFGIFFAVIGTYGALKDVLDGNPV